MDEESRGNEFGWWGKYHFTQDEVDEFYDACNRGEKPEKPRRIIWIGPMTRKLMLDDFCEFRHNFSLLAPKIGETNG